MCLDAGSCGKTLSEFVDQDYDVHFSRQNKSTIRPNVTGEEILMKRDGQLWAIFAQVVPFEECTQGVCFQGCQKLH
eukprot:1831399-Karenia_brevis.AAC.1